MPAARPCSTSAPTTACCTRSTPTPATSCGRSFRAQLAPDLWKLAEHNYATKHKYYVDGSPPRWTCGTAPTWRTILVGGLNAGGRGYYALDVTNPRAPQALWEFCSDATLCPVADEDLGFSFGNPVISKRASRRPAGW